MLFRADRLRSEQGLMTRIEDLDARSRSAYLELSRHYWQRGRLPATDRDLAAICKVTVISFRKMKVQIGWAFDARDADGRWRDYELESERVAAMSDLGLDPAEYAEPASAVAPVTAKEAEQSPRSRAGQRNAEIRWARDRQRRQAGTAFGIELASEAMPNGMPNGDNGMADGTPVALARHAPSLREEDEDSSESSSSSSSSDSRGEADANADRHAGRDATNASRPAKLGATPSPRMGDAGFDYAALEQRHKLTGDAIRQAIVKAIGAEKIAFDLHGPGVFDPIWRLIEDGCDLRRDIVPALTHCRTLTGPLNWLGAAFILERSRANRDRPHRPVSGADLLASGAGPKVWIVAGSEQEKAWKAYEVGRPDAGRWLNKEYTGSDRRCRDTRGWYRASEWPPGHAPAAVAAE